MKLFGQSVSYALSGTSGEKAQEGLKTLMLSDAMDGAKKLKTEQKDEKILFFAGKYFIGEADEQLSTWLAGCGGQFKRAESYRITAGKGENGETVFDSSVTLRVSAQAQPPCPKKTPERRPAELIYGRAGTEVVFLGHTGKLHLSGSGCGESIAMSIPMLLEDAAAAGYEPCSVCFRR